MQHIAEALADCQPLGAARLVLFCGSYFQAGLVDASFTTPAVADLFRRQLTLITPIIQSVPENEEPPYDLSALAEGQQREAIQSYAILCQGFAYYLAVSPELRSSLKQDQPFMAQLETAEGLLPETSWICETLETSSGEIVVLAPGEQKGFLVAYRNLSKCFHFFTLLQEALASHFRLDLAPHASAIAMARGDKAINHDETDCAIWTYCDYHGLDDKFSLVWGEMAPAYIPKFEGKQIVLLLPLAFYRSWNATFFGPRLGPRSSVEIIQVLPRQEVIERCERLQQQSKQ
jgi:hypothetical protein